MKQKICPNCLNTDIDTKIFYYNKCCCKPYPIQVEKPQQEVASIAFNKDESSIFSVAQQLQSEIEFLESLKKEMNFQFFAKHNNLFWMINHRLNKLKELIKNGK